MKGVLLAGGTGSRLDPLTRITNKHLLPVYDRPMIMYALETLRAAGISDVMVVTGSDHVDDFRRLLGDDLAYGKQERPGGIAEALGLAREFAAGDRIIVMLAVTGLYCYDADVFDVIASLEPSARGELEITDVNNHYVRAGVLGFDVFEGYWGDAGESIDAYYEVIERARRPHFGSDLPRPLALRRFDDARGWLAEIARTSNLPKPIRQTNVSFSRKGTIRGLHYHERGQDDLFVCLQGRARVVALDRETGETFCEDIGEGNFAGVYVPGNLAHGYEALTDVLMLYHVTEEYDPADPDEHRIAWDDPRVVDLWSTKSPILSERDSASS